MGRARVKGNAAFNFDQAVDMRLPVAGATDSARHSSATGAVAAAKVRPLIALKYWDLFEKLANDAPRFGALSDHEASDILGCGLSTINSTRNQYNEVGAGEPDRIIPSGTFEDHKFADGRRTKRTRWIRRDLLAAFTEKVERHAYEVGRYGRSQTHPTSTEAAGE